MGPLAWLLASRDPRRQVVAVWCVLFLAVVLCIGGMPTQFDTLSPLQIHVVAALLAGGGAAWLWSRAPRLALPVLLILFAVLLGLLIATAIGYWIATSQGGAQRTSSAGPAPAVLAVGQPGTVPISVLQETGIPRLQT